MRQLLSVSITGLLLTGFACGTRGTSPCVNLSGKYTFPNSVGRPIPVYVTQQGCEKLYASGAIYKEEVTMNPASPSNIPGNTTVYIADGTCRSINPLGPQSDPSYCVSYRFEPTQMVQEIYALRKSGGKSRVILRHYSLSNEGKRNFVTDSFFYDESGSLTNKTNSSIRDVYDRIQ